MSSSGSDEASTSTKGSAPSRSAKNYKKLLFIGVSALILIALAIVLPNDKSTRTESYEDVSGAAGLDATITYDGEPVSDVNIYMFNDGGQQISIVRPDKNGRVRLALPEGDYVMLIGKRLGGDNTFPQEPLALKNGKKLEIKLQYGEG